MQKSSIHIAFQHARPGEWKIIQTIAHATWPVTYGQLLPAGQLEYMLDLIYNEEAIKQQMNLAQQFIIGYSSNEPLGFASIEKQFKSSSSMMIHKLYILPAFQGNGIGRIFLNYLTNLATQTGHSELTLKVFVRNQNAIRFYQHLGFHSIGEVVTEIGNGYTVKDYVMLREIGNGLLA